MRSSAIHSERQNGDVPQSKGFRRTFAGRGHLSLGLTFPIEAYSGEVPRMEGQLDLACRAEELGYSTLWVRDVPLRDPSFGDVGQIYDPWVWLGAVATVTKSIALATGAIALPLHHPLDVAKSATSVDSLSGGRLVLGLASGDRAVEYGAYGRPIGSRGADFRESLAYIRDLTESTFPRASSSWGTLDGSADLLPKPVAGRLPVLVTGRAQQDMAWIGREADGWLTYPRPPAHQAQALSDWDLAVETSGASSTKPFAQSLYVDLTESVDAAPTPIHLGWRLGRKAMLELLAAYREIGIEHILLNLKYSRRPADEVVEEIGSDILPVFATGARL
ncbi:MULTISPECIES: LLM class oxidoreductase [unclassified Roseitalea]|uniref:LLM class oxidoreductase n=1 Tax=unclassified Roseitalea TaxID=2639107 RepID=UPI00273E5803|nr:MULTISPECIES: LLM class oxidoreductase [unclassified Roseitalea]